MSEQDCTTLGTLWDQLVEATNAEGATQHDIDLAYEFYDQEVEKIMVAGGHPPGRPRRHPH